MEKTLSAYRVFYEAASEGNISRAARKLELSQPAVSKTLAKLESELDAKLLNRNSRGVYLTEAGEALYVNLAEAFECIERGEQELKLIKEANHGHIKLGGATALCKYLLVPYLREFIMTYPFTKIAIDIHNTTETIKNIERGSVDAGIVVMVQPPRGFKFIKLMDVQDIFVCTPEYLKYFEDLFGKDADLFKNANFMLLLKGNSSRTHIDEYFRENGLQPTRRVEVSNMDLLIDFAKISVGIAPVIREFVLSELNSGKLVEIPMKAAVPKRQAGFLYLESNTNEALKRFINCVV